LTAEGEKVKTGLAVRWGKRNGSAVLVPPPKVRDAQSTRRVVNFASGGVVGDQLA
jgi:hypothetical protein